MILIYDHWLTISDLGFQTGQRLGYDTHIWLSYMSNTNMIIDIWRAGIWYTYMIHTYEIHVYDYRHMMVLYMIHTSDTHIWVTRIWFSYMTIIYELHVYDYRCLTIWYMIHAYDARIWETRIWVQTYDDTVYDTHIWYSYMSCTYMILIYEQQLHLMQAYDRVGIW